jgi:uncharacterized membrane protein
MLARSQRILAAIELFALALWVGGLFFMLAFAAPAFRLLFPEEPDTVWRVSDALYTRFGALEAIFAVVVLISSVMKMVVFRGLNELQRVAVLVAAIMLTVALFSNFQLRPLIEEKRAGFPTLNHGSGSPADEIVRFDKLRGNYETFMKLNLVLGLFMLYAYRSFEERKLQAITKILKAP